MKSFFRTLSDTGVSFADSKSEKRNIIMTNYISMVAAAAPVLLAISRIFYDASEAALITRMLIGAVFFLSPLLLNHFGFTNLSRIVLCWLPAAAVFILSITDLLEDISSMSASSFVGLRLFLIAISCFPFLVFNVKNTGMLALGLSVTLIGLLFFDPILDAFNVGISRKGFDDPFYYFNNVRALVSFIVIGLSFFFLKRIVEHNEEVNDALLSELAEKNELIRRQAADEVHQLNQQLQANVRQLSEREFILNQSQRIAKIGSWEYRIEKAFLFWSEEMYNIFALDKSFDLRTENLYQVMWGDAADTLIQATTTLLQLGKSFDLTLQARTPFGYQKWVRVYAFPILEEDRITGARGICHDVTYYKEADRMLRISENKYRSLFEQASDAILITDFKGSFTDVNETLCRMFGYSKEELLQMKISSLMEPERFRKEPIRFELLATGEHVRNERYMLHRDGTVRIVEANVKKFGDNEIMAIVRDVTELRKIQKEAQINEANLHATINNTEVMIWSVDQDFKLLTFNRKFSQYIQEKYNVMINSGARVFGNVNLETEEMTSMWRQLYTRALSGEVITLEETKFNVDFQYSISPIREGEMIIGVSVFADNVTERKVRDRELSEANKKIGELKLMALRSVMSPHFIFNVLNSIQFFIAKNDRLNAITYLSTFSKLIRSILTHSVDNKIKLSDEIDMLRNYVQLEMTRFENKFDFVLNIDKDLEVDSIELPSLLIQPYVENAVLHGLYNKKEKGTLSISISELDGVLMFKIEDDGIGRQEAMKLRKQSFPSHKSMGINLTEERLKLINVNHDAAFEIEDLTDGNGPTGTRVTIRVVVE